MSTDKTGAEATVTAEDGKYTIAVDGETVGLAAVADRGEQRVFYHTEVDERFGGRGLATILIHEALRPPAPMASESSRSARRWPCSSRSTPSSATSPIRSGRTSCSGSRRSSSADGSARRRTGR